MNIAKPLRVLILLALLLTSGPTVSADTNSIPAAVTVGTKLYMVKDIHNPAGSQPVTGINLRIPAAFGDKLFFGFNDGSNGYEPWISDGTEAGTKMLVNIDEGSWDGLLTNLGVQVKVANQTLYFLDSEHKTWKTDGTPKGTQLSNIPFSDSMLAVGDEVYYITNGPKLYVTEGGQSSSVLVKTWDKYSQWYGMEQLDEKFFFYLYPDPYNNTQELWTSNGTDVGTFRLFTSTTRMDYVPSLLKVANGLLFFIAITDQYGIELWQTDGTLGGTQLVGDEVTDGDLLINGLTVVGDTLYFTGDYGMGRIALYKTKGQSTGVEKVYDFVDITSLTDVTGKLYFRASDGSGYRIWMSNGTSAGTKEVCPTCVYSLGGWLTAFNGKLYFSASDDTNGNELWETDGTPSGTRILADINPGPASSNPARLTVVREKLFFGADDGVHGHELWVYDIKSNNHIYLPAITR